MRVTVSLLDEAIEVQRIFCIGRNYAAHAAELGNDVPGEPVVFMKPPSAIVHTGSPIPLPRNRGSVHHEAELVLLVGRDHAHDVEDIAGIALGLDLTLRDEQARLKAAGLPWELAKAFDASAPLGSFAPLSMDIVELAFECRVNGVRRQLGEVRNMLFPAAQLLSFLSGRFDLRRGDLVFTGTPEGVGPLQVGDYVELFAESLGRHGWHCV